MLKASWQRLCLMMSRFHTRVSERADNFSLWNATKAWRWKERGR